VCPEGGQDDVTVCYLAAGEGLQCAPQLTVLDARRCLDVGERQRVLVVEQHQHRRLQHSKTSIDVCFINRLVTPDGQNVLAVEQYQHRCRHMPSLRQLAFECAVDLTR